MPFFTSPTSFERANSSFYSFNALPQDAQGVFQYAASTNQPPATHPAVPHLMLLVFEAVMEVVCVSLPGYIVARMGMFDADSQKFLANLNVMLFTPCLIFTKLASQLTAGKLADLAIIPAIFLVQTAVSYACGTVVARCFGFKKRQSNFVKAMAVFGNSNSLPISLVISLSKTIQGLHWDRIPNDNDEEVAARGILYLLIFQQLGQLLRWSWGYHVLLAPREYYYRDVEDAAGPERIHDRGDRYTDDPGEETDYTAVGTEPNSGEATPHRASSDSGHGGLEADERTSLIQQSGSYMKVSATGGAQPVAIGPDGESAASIDNIVHFPSVENRDGQTMSSMKKWGNRAKWSILSVPKRVKHQMGAASRRVFASLPKPMQKFCSSVTRVGGRFLRGVWSFMNPPLWAMLVAIFVASVPALQRLMFTPGTFISNSVTRAISQSGGVAVPLILVVLGANLERNTIPEVGIEDHEHPKEERNLIIASLLARMLLPTLIMGPIIALIAKQVPVNILDDPIFIVVCFLLTGAPSALQLAQICQINNVYMNAMSRLLFQSYVIWILPSTLVLVMSALEVVEWAVI